jgi:hypothetical protein
LGDTWLLLTPLLIWLLLYRQLLAARSAAAAGSTLLTVVSAVSVVSSRLHRESRNSSLLYQLFSFDWLLLQALRSPWSQDMMVGKLC